MDYPIIEIVEKANEALNTFPGSSVFFKFTCSHCGARQSFETPNTLHTSGTCEECGNVTTIDKAGFRLEIRQ